jgi:beta-carotene 3-hydroxylase
MTWYVALFIVIASVIGMEVFAWFIHKYVMHSRWGWGWHESHHTETEGYFEKNDLYAVCFSVIAASLFIIGSMGYPVLWMIALGLTIYGVLYGIVHDGLVHQRWPFFVHVKGGYLKRLVQAHRLHHAVHERDGAVSFGFLYAEDVRSLKAQLKANQSKQSESTSAQS